MYLFCVRKLNMTKFEYLWVSVHIYILHIFYVHLWWKNKKKQWKEREKERIIIFIYYGILL